MKSRVLDESARIRLSGFLSAIGDVLGDRRRRESFALYALGLLGEGERKSVEPIAARLVGSDKQMQRMHDNLLHFLGGSRWEDTPVRRFAAGYALDALADAGERVEAWIVDDTGFLKQGHKSPGVQRQYTGSAGKTANCQHGVSLTLATRTAHVPIDFDLYLPEVWISDPARRRAAKIPNAMVYRPKWRMALDMMVSARKAGVAAGVVLADAFCGDTAAFRHGISGLDLRYAVDIHSNTRVCAGKKKMVRLLKQRWRTERVYQDMKGELGLGGVPPQGGRSFRGTDMARLASPSHRRPVLLCLLRRRPRPLFFPLGRTDE